MSLDSLKSFFITETSYGGLERKISDHLLDGNTARKTDNFTIRKDGLETVNGWEELTAQILTDGAASPAVLQVIGLDEFFKNDGTSYFIAYTNKRAYFFRTSNSQWIPFSPATPASTTVDQDSALGAKNLYVASTVGYAAGDHIIVNEGGAREEIAVVDSVDTGVKLVVKVNLTYTHTAVQADEVHRLYYCATVDSDSAAAQDVLSVDYTDRFTVGEEIIIGLGTAREEYAIVDTINAGTSIVITKPQWRKDMVSGLGDELEFTHTAVQADKITRVAELTYVVTASDPTNIDSFNSNEDGGRLYFTDGLNTVQIWDGPAASPTFHESLAGLDDVEDLTLGDEVEAKYIRQFENFIILANLVEDGTALQQKIRWNQLGEPTIWKNNADGSGSAGYANFEGPDFLVGAFQLKRELFFYRERNIEAMSFVGEPEVFSFRRAETGTGLLAPKALVDLGDSHVFVGPDNIYENNGISLQPIGDSIKDDFYSTLVPSRRDNVKMFFLEETDEIWLSFSTLDEDYNDKAYIYNHLLRKWSGPRDIDERSFGYFGKTGDVTWDDLVGTWDEQVNAWDSRYFLSNAPLNMMGTADGRVMTLDLVTTKDGATITSVYESRLSALGAGEIMKRVQMIRAELRRGGASDTVSVQIGTARFVGDNIAWGSAMTLSIAPDAEPFVYPDASGRWFKIRITTTVPTAIREIEVFFLPGGHS